MNARHSSVRPRWPVHRIARSLLIALFLCSYAAISSAHAAALQTDAQKLSRLEDRVNAIQNRMGTVERRVNGMEEEAAGVSLALFLIGCFCALWAQNTRRSAWGWFFLGVFFHIFTLLVLLKKNSDDLDDELERTNPAAV
ncbi:MAG: hypothetical protein WEE89_18830 [Gemmatimonadota bacterium]